MVAIALGYDHQKWKNQQNEYSDVSNAPRTNISNVSSIAGHNVESLLGTIPGSCVDKVSVSYIFCYDPICNMFFQLKLQRQQQQALNYYFENKTVSNSTTTRLYWRFHYCFDIKLIIFVVCMKKKVGRFHIVGVKWFFTLFLTSFGAQKFSFEMLPKSRQCVQKLCHLKCIKFMLLNAQLTLECALKKCVITLKWNSEKRN